MPSDTTLSASVLGRQGPLYYQGSDGVFLVWKYGASTNIGTESDPLYRVAVGLHVAMDKEFGDVRNAASNYHPDLSQYFIRLVTGVETSVYGTYSFPATDSTYWEGGSQHTISVPSDEASVFEHRSTAWTEETVSLGLAWEITNFVSGDSDTAFRVSTTPIKSFTCESTTPLAGDDEVWGYSASLPTKITTVTLHRYQLNSTTHAIDTTTHDVKNQTEVTYYGAVVSGNHRQPFSGTNQNFSVLGQVMPLEGSLSYVNELPVISHLTYSTEAAVNGSTVGGRVVVKDTSAYIGFQKQDHYYQFRCVSVPANPSDAGSDRWLPELQPITNPYDAPDGGWTLQSESETIRVWKRDYMWPEATEPDHQTYTITFGGTDQNEYGEVGSGDFVAGRSVDWTAFANQAYGATDPDGNAISHWHLETGYWYAFDDRNSHGTEYWNDPYSRVLQPVGATVTGLSAWYGATSEERANGDVDPPEYSQTYPSSSSGFSLKALLMGLDSQVTSADISFTFQPFVPPTPATDTTDYDAGKSCSITAIIPSDKFLVGFYASVVPLSQLGISGAVHGLPPLMYRVKPSS